MTLWTMVVMVARAKSKPKWVKSALVIQVRGQVATSSLSDEGKDNNVCHQKLTFNDMTVTFMKFRQITEAEHSWEMAPLKELIIGTQDSICCLWWQKSCRCWLLALKKKVASNNHPRKGYWGHGRTTVQWKSNSSTIYGCDMAAYLPCFPMNIGFKVWWDTAAYPHIFHICLPSAMFLLQSRDKLLKASQVILAPEVIPEMVLLSSDWKNTIRIN